MVKSRSDPCSANTYLFVYLMMHMPTALKTVALNPISSMQLDANIFRANRLYNEDVDILLKEKLPILKAIFDHYKLLAVWADKKYVNWCRALRMKSSVNALPVFDCTEESIELCLISETFLFSLRVQDFFSEAFHAISSHNPCLQSP